ncbi:hypothetical protein OSK10_28085, partial [Escherichia coli]|nr:hypothetical protein [Escherichia coli]
SEQTALELDHLPEHREHVPSFVREAREDAIRQYPNGADPHSPQSLPGEPAAAEYPDLQDAPLIDLSPSAEELPEADQH